MRNLLFLSFIALALSLSLTQSSYADCGLTGTIPGEGNIINCPLPLQASPLNGGSDPMTTDDDDIVTVPDPGGIEINDPLLAAIDTLLGTDEVTIAGRVVNFGNGPGIFAGIAGSDTIIVNPGAEISGGFLAGILMSPFGVDLVTINGGSVTGNNSGAAVGTLAALPKVFTMNGGTIDTDGPNVYFGAVGLAGTDIVEIHGGEILNGQIDTNSGFDSVLITGGTWNGGGIDTGANVNTIHVTTDVPDIGNMDCGTGGGFFGGPDTLIFSMSVPAPEVAQLTADFEAAGDDGDLTVNGIFYDWEDCEIRVANFNGFVQTISLAPLAAVNEIGDTHTVTATVLRDGVPTEGIEVEFNIIAGANDGLSGTSTTNSDGEATFSYASDVLGQDIIISFFEDDAFGQIRSNPVTKTWILPSRNVPTLSEWGLIAMASILGIVGFMVIRRRQLTA